MIIKINLSQKGEPYQQHWRVCVGGGRVAEALRADFQKHLELIQREMPFQRHDFRVDVELLPLPSRGQ